MGENSTPVYLVHKSHLPHFKQAGENGGKLTVYRFIKSPLSHSKQIGEYVGNRALKC